MDRYKVAGLEQPTAAAEPAPVQQEAEPAYVAPSPTANEGVHPLAISAEEGMPAAPQEKLLKLLQKILKLKYGGMILYTNYGDRIRAHFRDAIYAHFQEHLKEEREGAYDLAMKITALGGEPIPQVGSVPDANNLHQMFMNIMVAEKELIQAERDLLAACGEYDGLRILIEGILLLDQRHLDDARRMMFCEGGSGGSVP